MKLFCEEPFRVFFPLGLLLGMLGVSLWPIYYTGFIATYPGTAHARLMIEGLMASFIIGFLGTAGPRITSTPHFSRAELTALLTLVLLAAGLHVGAAHRAADLVFLFCLLIFLFVLGRRFVRREDSPPPNFVLVALGLCNGIAGSLLVSLFENEVYTTQYRLGALLLEQGFILLPILGVAPFLLPRLLDRPRTDDLPESRVLPPGWRSRATFAAMAGLLIDGTFLLEATDHGAIAGWARLTVLMIYLGSRMPWRGRSFLGDSLRLGIAAVVAGFAVEALWPHYRIGALHIIFISGFSAIILTVAIRVVFGHSGNAHLFRKRLPFFIVTSALLWIAMLSRYVADLAPRTRTIHLVAAAGFWLGAALLWMIKVVPKVTIPDPEG